MNRLLLLFILVLISSIVGCSYTPKYKDAPDFPLPVLPSVESIKIQISKSELVPIEINKALKPPGFIPLIYDTECDCFTVADGSVGYTYQAYTIENIKIWEEIAIERKALFNDLNIHSKELRLIERSWEIDAKRRQLKIEHVLADLQLKKQYIEILLVNLYNLKEDVKYYKQKLEIEVMISKAQTILSIIAIAIVTIL